MNYKNIIQDIIFWIENNLEQPLSIDQVAEKSGYSKWHLQRMFKSITGQILGSYIRARRLTCTALALRLTNKPILDIVIQYQFDSQQTFTRAFKKQFKQTPANYRRAEIFSPTGLIPRLELQNKPVLPMGEKVFLAEKKLKGITHNYSCSLLTATKSKHNLREQFWLKLSKQIPVKEILPAVLYGLNRVIPSKLNNEEQDIFYTTAIEPQYINDIENIADITLQQGEYLKFCFSGNINNFDHFVTMIYTHSITKLNVCRRWGEDIEIIHIPSITTTENNTICCNIDYFIPITTSKLDNN